MSDPFNNDSHSHWIPFADTLAGILAIFLVVAVLLTFHIQVEKKNHEADIVSPGAISVVISWKEDVDVDLWLRSPGDNPVGYSRKQGLYIDLLRDDLGRDFERVGDHHEENAYARSTPPGEWIVNLHMFANRSGAAFPIKVAVSVTIAKKGQDQKETSKRVINATAFLTSEGQELTVIRFKIDGNADLVAGSVNDEQIPLRSAPKQ
jgi:hypothetical protein